MKTAITILALMFTTPALADETIPLVNKGMGSPQMQCFDDKTCLDAPCWQEPTNWHLMTKSRGGTVSLIKGITKKECEIMRHHLGAWCDRPAGVYNLNPGDIETAECFE